ncbi:phospholipase D-like domain-containing protein [Bacteroidota bacterium]
MMLTRRYISVLILALVFGIPAMAQVISISDARALGPGKSVTISGIVINGDELGVIRYVQDASGGLAIYDPGKMEGIVLGDSITVSGKLVDYNNLLEIQPVTSVVVEKKGAKLPDPVVVTPSQLTEPYEGMLIEIENALIDDAGKTFAAKTNYDFTSGEQTGEFRISDAASPFIGQVIPSGSVSIVGILAHFYDIYQVLVRGTSDISASSNISFLTPPVIENLSTSGFSIKWETDSTGTTEILYGNTPALELGHMSVPGTGIQHSISITGADPSELFYVKPFSVRNLDTAEIFTQVYITQSISSGNMKAYFNRPVDNSLSSGSNAVYLEHAIDDTLIAYINRASESIDFTIYNFNNAGISNIASALNAAHARGVVVRVVYDVNQNNFGTDELNAGIGKMASPVSNYPIYGIMHNKFVVFDALSNDPDVPLVWTGATNFTDTQINMDPNNVIIIQDKSLAMAYRLEFNEMFGSDGTLPDAGVSRFGPDKIDNTPHEFIIAGKRVESYFSPSDGTHSKILSTIKSADKDISAATMLITKTDIGYGIRDRAEAGVTAKILVNNEAGCFETVVSTLLGSLSTNFRVSGEAGIMHHKYLIVDHSDSLSDPILLTGCHNWSASAEDRNDENTLLIHDPTMANVYYQEFANRFKAGSFLDIVPPVCHPDYVTMSSGPSFNYNVVNNDQIPGPAGIEINRQPSHGTANVETDQTITYWPEAGFDKDIDTVFYKICAEANSSICDSSIMVIYVNYSVGIENIRGISELKVYPNPSSGEVFISIAEDFQPITLTITDLAGRKLHTEREINIINGEHRISLDAFQNGYYYLILEDLHGRRIIQPVILRR